MLSKMKTTLKKFLTMNDKYSWTFPFSATYSDFAELTMYEAIHDGFKKNTYAYRCVRIISENAGSVDWEVYKRKPNSDMVLDDAHPLNYIIDKPNGYQTWCDLNELIVEHLNLCGNAVLKKVRQGNNPNSRVIGLIPISPDIIEPIVKEDGSVDEYEIVHGNKQGTRIVRDDLIHFKFTNPATPTWGCGPLQTVSSIIETDNKSVLWNKNSMDNRAIADGVFMVEDELTQSQYDDIRLKVKNQMQGSANSRGVFVVSGGRMRWQEMSRTPAEMDFINSRKMYREEICSAFGVPPVLVEVYENAIYNNVSEAKYILWMNTIIPILEKIKQTYQTQLIDVDFKGDGIKIEYDTSNVTALEKSFSEKVDNAVKLFNIGVPFNRLNQELELGFEELEDGDNAFIPANFIPVSAVSSMVDEDIGMQGTGGQDAEIEPEKQGWTYLKEQV